LHPPWDESAPMQPSASGAKRTGRTARRGARHMPLPQHRAAEAGGGAEEQEGGRAGRGGAGRCCPRAGVSLRLRAGVPRRACAPWPCWWLTRTPMQQHRARLPADCAPVACCWRRWRGSLHGQAHPMKRNAGASMSR
jgi:hypothetical protein